jgi:hypothetical protein
MIVTGRFIAKSVGFKFHAPCQAQLGGVSVAARVAGGARAKKKAGVVEHPEVFDHAGLLVNGTTGNTGLPFIKSSDQIR